MSDEAKVERPHPREPLWRAALWAGFAHQEQIVTLLQAGKTPWFTELSPLTRSERVFIMAQLCKAWFPEMLPEGEKSAVQMLGAMYGVVDDMKKRSKKIKRLRTAISWEKPHGH